MEIGTPCAAYGEMLLQQWVPVTPHLGNTLGLPISAGYSNGMYLQPLQRYYHRASYWIHWEVSAIIKSHCLPHIKRNSVSKMPDVLRSPKHVLL